MTSIRILPLHVGTITRQVTNFCHGLEPAIVDLPLICWYIEGSDKKILVDTGGGDPTRIHPKLQPYRRDEGQAIEHALKRIGVACEDVEMVIVTHLHWDHSAGNSLFPKARIVVQDEELRVARNPFPAMTFAYIRDAVEKVNYSVISGDADLARGVKVILTPGHTYGLQGVLVEGERRRIFIAGDTLPLFKNIEQDPPVISNLYVDIKSYYDSLKKIVSLSALILPSHDFGVFEKEAYL